MDPFLSACRNHGAGLFCLVRTSNAGGRDLQDAILSDGTPVWRHVAGLVAEWGADFVGERGHVERRRSRRRDVPRVIGDARRAMPQAIILLPGVGAQGATPADVARAFTSGPASALVNASRSVIYAYRDRRRRLACSRGRRRRGRAGPPAEIWARWRGWSVASAGSSGNRLMRSTVRRHLAAALVYIRVCSSPPPRPAPPPRAAAPASVVRVIVAARSVVLASRAPDVQRAPASITKLMTVLVALEHARLDESSPSPRRPPGSASRRSLRPGEQLDGARPRIAALVPSANDAATALAVHVGQRLDPALRRDDEREGSRLGLTQTHSRTRTASKPGHVSSARDMTTLLTAALRNPFIRTWSTRSTATIPGGSDAHLDRRPDRPLPSSAPRPATRMRPAGRRSRRRARTACGSRLGARFAERGAAKWRSRRPARLGPRAVPPREGGGWAPRVRPRRDRVRARAGEARGGARDRPQGAGRAALSSSASSQLGAPTAGGTRPARRRGAGVRGRKADRRTPLVTATAISAVGARGQGRVVRPPHRSSSRGDGDVRASTYRRKRHLL